MYIYIYIAARKRARRVARHLCKKIQRRARRRVGALRPLAPQYVRGRPPPKDRVLHPQAPLPRAQRHRLQSLVCI